VKKPFQYGDIQTRQIKRKSEVTKNELLRERIETGARNALKFRFVLIDSVFSSEENVDFITSKDCPFISALKNNRFVALSEEDRKRKSFVQIDELNFTEHTAMPGGSKGTRKPYAGCGQSLQTKTGAPGSGLWFAVT
jgi:hypothetical protein